MVLVDFTVVTIYDSLGCSVWLWLLWNLLAVGY